MSKRPILKYARCMSCKGEGKGKWGTCTQCQGTGKTRLCDTIGCLADAFEEGLCPKHLRHPPPQLQRYSNYT